MTVVFGFAYPLLVTGVGQLAFHDTRTGQPGLRGGHVVGSRLAAQPFTSPRYFHPRPSATTPPYNAGGTTFSNLGPTNPALRKALRGNAARPAARAPVQPGVDGRWDPGRRRDDVGSGIDPDISPAIRAVAGAAHRRRAPVAARPCAVADQGRDRRALARLLRRAGRQRALRSTWRSTRSRSANELHAPRALFSKQITLVAIRDSFPKLDPRTLAKNPVIFIVELGSVIVSFIFVQNLVFGGRHEPLWFTGTVAVWLWLTVLFANFAEAVAEGRGKAQANALRADADDDRRPHARAAGDRGSAGGRRSQRATSLSSRPARSSPRTARSSRASARSTSPRSPASRRR